MKFNQKLPKSKVFRDPMYGNIIVEYQIIWDLINTKEVQRLRRIRQLSGVSIVFHTAEHSRFSHSLGAYHLAYRFIKESVLDTYFDEYQKVLFLVTALLHDIGHGPFSHAFERAFKINHELIGTKIILGETEVGNILREYDNMGLDVSNILLHKSKYKIIESLISSQLDVDRLDYLNRDAYMTNANYGYVDVDRIIRILNIKDNKICYSSKGLEAIENYLMSRYHMYAQIYYHNRARSYEVLLESIYNYIEDHKKTFKIGYAPSFLQFLNNKEDIKAYLKLDDYYIVGMIEELASDKDETLAYLANNFLNRHLPSFILIEDDILTKEEEKVINYFKEHQDLARYFYKEEKVSQSTYLHSERMNINDILILKNDKIMKIEEASKIISGLILSGKKEIRTIYYDKSKL